MRPSISKGVWCQIDDAGQHKKLQDGRVNIGEFVGPGRYLMLNYHQPCPRGCCEDSVRELIPEADVRLEVEEEIADLNSIIDGG